MSHLVGRSLPLEVMGDPGVAPQTPSAVRISARNPSGVRLAPWWTDVETREDLFDRLLRWVHRLLNPPRPSPTSTSGGRRPRRVRDRVPI